MVAPREGGRSEEEVMGVAAWCEEKSEFLGRAVPAWVHNSQAVQIAWGFVSLLPSWVPGFAGEQRMYFTAAVAWWSCIYIMAGGALQLQVASLQLSGLVLHA